MIGNGECDGFKIIRIGQSATKSLIALISQGKVQSIGVEYANNNTPTSAEVFIRWNKGGVQWKNLYIVENNLKIKSIKNVYIVANLVV